MGSGQLVEGATGPGVTVDRSRPLDRILTHGNGARGTQEERSRGLGQGTERPGQNASYDQRQRHAQARKGWNITLRKLVYPTARRS